MSLQQRETNLFGLHIGRGGGTVCVFIRGQLTKYLFQEISAPPSPVDTY